LAEDVIMGSGSKRSAGRDRGPVDPGNSLPNSAEGLTVELLNRIVAEWHPGSSVTDVELVEAKGLAQQVSTAGRARLRLTYGPGSAALPRDVIVKMVIGAAGVDGALYETEVQIYRDVLPGLDIPQITCIGAAYEDKTERLILLLEDLTAKQPFFPLSTDKPLSPERVAGQLSILAKVHARYWDSPDLDGMRDWLGTLLEGRQFDFLEAITVPAITQMMDESMYRADIVARTGWTPQQLGRGQGNPCLPRQGVPPHAGPRRYRRAQHLSPARWQLRLLRLATVCSRMLGARRALQHYRIALDCRSPCA
jgi:hypothetical protein